MDGRRAGRVVEWRIGGCLPTVIALAVLVGVVAIALALGTFVIAGVVGLALVLYAVRAVRRLAGGRRGRPRDDGHPWREIGRSPLPPQAPPRRDAR